MLMTVKRMTFTPSFQLFIKYINRTYQQIEIFERVLRESQSSHPGDPTLFRGERRQGTPPPDSRHSVSGSVWTSHEQGQTVLVLFGSSLE